MKIKQGRKDDTGKPRYDLVPPEALELWVEGLTHGANKYEDRNWEKGLKWGRIFGAAMRHMWAWWRGEWLDKDSKLPHLALAMCEISFLITYEVRKMKKYDDRP